MTPHPPVVNYEIWIQRSPDEEAEMVASFDDEHCERTKRANPDYMGVPNIRLKKMLAEQACARQAAMDAKDEWGKGIFQVRASTNGMVMFERRIRWP